MDETISQRQNYSLPKKQTTTKHLGQPPFKLHSMERKYSGGVNQSARICFGDGETGLPLSILQSVDLKLWLKAKSLEERKAWGNPYR